MSARPSAQQGVRCDIQENFFSVCNKTSKISNVTFKKTCALDVTSLSGVKKRERGLRKFTNGKTAEHYIPTIALHDKSE